MPVRYWMLVIALGGCLATAEALAENNLPSVGQQPQDSEEVGKSETGQATTADQIPPSPVIDDPDNQEPGAGINQDTCDQAEADQVILDLCQQWEMAKATAWQAEVTAKLYHLTKLEILLLIPTLVASVIATFAAAASFWQTRVVSRKELRAYLTVTGVTVKNTGATESPNISVKITNLGNTPAYNVQTRALTCHFERKKEDFDLSEVKPSKHADVGPTQNIYRNSILTAVEWAVTRPVIETRAENLYVFGVISYVDEFREPHTTGYRAMLFVDDEGIADEDEFILCDEGNWMT